MSRYGRSMKPTASRFTHFLLGCGAFAGPLFVFTVLVQSYTVPGFDQRHHLLSLLSLGPYGYVQIANFVVAGVLYIAFAIGIRRLLYGRPSGTITPILVGIFGCVLIVVGVFTTDPANGFPPGAIASKGPSWHGAIHALGALWAFVFCSASLASFIRHFHVTRQTGWIAFCGTSAIVMLIAFFGSFTSQEFTARLVDLGVAIGWIGNSIVAVKLLSDHAAAQRAVTRAA